MNAGNTNKIGKNRMIALKKSGQLRQPNMAVKGLLSATIIIWVIVSGLLSATIIIWIIVSELLSATIIIWIIVSDNKYCIWIIVRKYGRYKN